jgi:FKBP-type peptidyl-prolyl cis-trans isomerase FklB
MRIILSIALSICLFLGHALAAEQQPQPNLMKRKKARPAVAVPQRPIKDMDPSQKEKMSYSLGYDTGKRMQTNVPDVDLEVYIQAFRDGFVGKPATMNEQERREAVLPLERELQARRTEQTRQLAEKSQEIREKSKRDGEAFLAENGKKEGVVTLPSGLQYKVVKEGTGKSPQKNDKVKVQYRGALIDGTEFDSSYKRGEAAEFAVDQVIKGWTEALQLMKEGAQWTIFVPADLAYGPRGFGAMVGPNSTLIFDVELISVQ